MSQCAEIKNKKKIKFKIKSITTIKYIMQKKKKTDNHSKILLNLFRLVTIILINDITINNN